MPRFSLAQIHAIASILLANGMFVTVYWVAAGRGPYPLFLALELGEGPSTHPLAAAGLTFLVIMVPAMALLMTLATLLPLQNTRSILSKSKMRVINRVQRWTASKQPPAKPGALLM